MRAPESLGRMTRGRVGVPVQIYRHDRETDFPCIYGDRGGRGCRVVGAGAVGRSRTYPVTVAGRKTLLASGTLRWEVPLERSSGFAVRILPSVHTNPIFAVVDGQPVRADRRSAEWCRRAVDVCCNSKQGNTRAREMEAAG